MLYVACHAVHGRQIEPAGGLSARQCAVLSHLVSQPDLSAAEMSRHLGLARSTLSEVVLRLVELRYLDSYADERDEQKRRLVLTEADRTALSSVPFLDEIKVNAVLSRLTPRERAKGGRRPGSPRAGGVGRVRSSTEMTPPPRCESIAQGFASDGCSDRSGRYRTNRGSGFRRLRRGSRNASRRSSDGGLTLS
jgi:DNA-binding MarR family transcriptional regulator